MNDLVSWGRRRDYDVLALALIAYGLGWLMGGGNE